MEPSFIHWRKDCTIMRETRPVISSAESTTRDESPAQADNFADGSFAQRGNLGKAHELIGEHLRTVAGEMYRGLMA